MTGRPRPRPSRRLARVLGTADSGRACLQRVGADALASALPSHLTRAALLAEAAHQANLLAHPYLGREHLVLAALRLTGRRSAWESMTSSLTPGLPASSWRPRGILSAARNRGRVDTARRQAEAIATESTRPWSNG
jgi:hypothetical protein